MNRIVEIEVPDDARCFYLSVITQTEIDENNSEQRALLVKAKGDEVAEGLRDLLVTKGLIEAGRDDAAS